MNVYGTEKSQIQDSIHTTIEGLSGIRVLLLFPHMVTPGGALFYSLRLASQLRDQGAVVTILTLQIDRNVVEVPDGVGVITLSGPLTSSLRYWLLFPCWQTRINRAVLAWHPDVLVPQVFPSNWWGWLHKRKYPGVKLAWVCHEPSAFIHSQPWMRALRPWWKSLLARSLQPFLARIDVLLARNCDRAIANSQFTAGEMERVYGIVPNGIARPGINMQNYTDGGNQKKERVILTVARLTRFKRIDFLLDVFAEVQKDCPDLIYYIVGTGEDEGWLRQKADRLGLKSRVVFFGSLDAQSLLELYQRSTLFLHGSVDEPFGMAPLEAIACGTPVVAHNSGGPKEFVKEECGRLVDSLNCSEWAKLIVEYLDLLACAADFSQNVQECARPFDWQHSLRPAIEIIAGLGSESGRVRLNSSSRETEDRR